MKRRSGFTLIELLVVIAIVAILAAILFPVFTKAKQKGWQSKCCNNAMQLGKAFRMYGDDWGGRFPICGEGGNAPGQCLLYNTLKKYISGGPGVFMCPADTGEACIGGSPAPFWKVGPFYSSWAWPAGAQWHWIVGQPMDNYAQGMTGPRLWMYRVPPSKRPVVFDHRPWHWSTKGTAWTNISGKNAVLWADGHSSMTEHNILLAFMDQGPLAGDNPPPGL